MTEERTDEFETWGAFRFIAPKPLYLAATLIVMSMAGYIGVYTAFVRYVELLHFPRSLNSFVYEPVSIPEVSVEYRNRMFGFSVALPSGWRGYTVLESRTDIYDVSTGSVVGQFPLIELIHPASTERTPRQRIPIFVFTHAQWAEVGNEYDGDWSVSAAPIPPRELARNSRYVFALPARYNYAFLEGFEEVEEILQSGAVKAFEP